MFGSVSHFHPSLVFASKAGAYHSGAPNSTLLLKLASSLARNIGLEWKWLTLTNTLAYYNTARITAVKSFIVQAPVVFTYFCQNIMKGFLLLSENVTKKNNNNKTLRKYITKDIKFKKQKHYSFKKLKFQIEIYFSSVQYFIPPCVRE